jgi:hypothetical protein
MGRKTSFTVALALAMVLGLCGENSRAASDPDIGYIMRVLRATPCDEVQVLAAWNIGVIRWSRQSMRYLYDEDIEILKLNARASGKRVIEYDFSFELPNLQDPDWMDAADKLSADLTELFESDFATHPPDGC